MAHRPKSNEGGGNKRVLDVAVLVHTVAPVF